MFHLFFALISFPEIPELRRVEDWAIHLSKAVQAADQDREEAERIYARALAVPAEHQFPAFPRAKKHNHYVSLLHRTGRSTLAVTEYERAAGFWRMAFGSASEDLATTLNNMAEVERLVGRYDRAEELYIKIVDDAGGIGGGIGIETGDHAEQPGKNAALAIRHAALPGDHPEFANSLNNLAAVLQDRGDLAGAEAAYRKALAIRESNRPGEALASALNNLGTLMRRRNRLPCPRWGGSIRRWRRSGATSATEPWYRRALAVSETRLGSTHPQTLTSVENLGALFLQQEKATGAEALFRRVLKTDSADGNARHHLAQGPAPATPLDGG